MAISLNVLLAIIITVVVLAVAAATLGITMTVSLDALDSVGSERARSLTTDVADLSAAYLGVLSYDSSSTQDVASMMGALPSDLSTNWTALYATSLFTALTDSNFTLFRARLVFEDKTWMHMLSSCVVTTTSVCTAWWEYQTGSSTWNIGGSSMSRTTFQADPAGPAEESTLPISPDPWTWALQETRTKSQMKKTCAWDGLKYYRVPGVSGIAGGKWILTAGCNLVNSSLQYLGRVQVDSFVDVAFNNFLSTVERSPNSVLFIIDSEQHVVATTQTDPYFTDRAATSINEAVTSPCFINNDTEFAGTNRRVGCFHTTMTYPFRPLQVQPSSFLLTAVKSLQTVEVDGKRYYSVSERIKSRFTTAGAISFNVVLFSPESDVIGDVEKGRNIAIGVTCGVFVIGAALAMWITSHLLKALTKVSNQLEAMGKLEDDEDEQQDMAALLASSGAAAGVAGAAASGAAGGGSQAGGSQAGAGGAAGGGGGGVAALPVKDKKKKSTSFDEEDQSVVSEFASLQKAHHAMAVAMKSFTKYAPRDVVRDLMQSGQLCTIAMEPRKCTILFSDILDFTAMAERLEPPQLSSLIQLYFEQMTAQVLFCGGVIDKMQGDSLMCVFGAPRSIDNQRLRGCLCGLALVRESQSDPLRGSFQAAEEVLSIRVGVAAGTVLAGNLGSSKRLSWTVVGDQVNLAARLESFNRQWDTHMLIPDDVAETVSPHLLLRKVIYAAIVGKELPVFIHEVVNMQPNQPAVKFESDVSGSFTPREGSEAGEKKPNNNNNATTAAGGGGTAGEDTEMSPRTAAAVEDKYASPSQVRAKHQTNSRHHKIEDLIKWHMTKGTASHQEQLFCQMYGGASTALKEMRWQDCLEAVKQIEEMPASTLSEVYTKHPSVGKIRHICDEAMKHHQQQTPSGNAEFIYRASEK